MSFQTSSPNSSNETSPVSPTDEPGQGDGQHRLEKEEPAFPHADLAKLDDMINRYFLCYFDCLKLIKLQSGCLQCLTAEYQNAVCLSATHIAE